MIISSRRLLSKTSFAAALIALIALTGCSGNPPAGVSSDAPASTSDAPSGSAGFEAARDAYDLKLAQCLREAGFDVKDPAPGEGITESGPELTAAASTCMQEIGDPPRADAKVDQTEMLNAMLVWAKCFRNRGLEVEEPKLGQAFFLPVDASDADVAACIDPL